MVTLVNTEDNCFIKKLQECFTNTPISNEYYRWEEYGGGYLSANPRKEVEIGYALFPPFRRQGRGYFIAEAITMLALQKYPSYRVVAYVPYDNMISMSILQRLGYVLVDKVGFNVFQYKPFCEISLVKTEDLSFILDVQQELGNRCEKKWPGHVFYRCEYGGGALRVDQEKGEIEICYVIFPQFRQQGKGTLLVKAITQMALELYPKFRIVAESAMPISTHILEKVGFIKQEGSIFWKGDDCDSDY